MRRDVKAGGASSKVGDGGQSFDTFFGRTEQARILQILNTVDLDTKSYRLL